MAKSEKTDQLAFNWCSRNARGKQMHLNLNLKPLATGGCQWRSMFKCGTLWCDIRTDLGRCPRALFKSNAVQSCDSFVLSHFSRLSHVSTDLSLFNQCLMFLGLAEAWPSLIAFCIFFVYWRFLVQGGSAPFQVAMVGVIVAKTHPGNATCVACLDEKTLKLIRPTPSQCSSPFWTDAQVASLQVGCRVHFEPTGHSSENEICTVSGRGDPRLSNFQPGVGR